MSSEIRRITPLLVVEAIEPGLDFWVERLGFVATAKVPDGDRLGFIILARDGTELMFQTRASLAADVPTLAGAPAATSLFIEVRDLSPVLDAVAGLEVLVPRRTTSYGMDEIGVREPGGHVVIFAQPTGQ